MTFTISKRVVALQVERKERPLPSLPRMAANLAASVIKSAASRAGGNPRLVTEATREIRRSRCQSNVCGYYRESDGRCAHPKCGCPVSQRGLIESKTELFAETCPNKPSQWGPGEIHGTVNK